MRHKTWLEYACTDRHQFGESLVLDHDRKYHTSIWKCTFVTFWGSRLYITLFVATAWHSYESNDEIWGSSKRTDIKRCQIDSYEI